MDENNNPIQEPGVKTQEPTTAETTQNVGAKKVNTMGLVSFIFSLVGLLVAALPCGIVSVITGGIGIAKFDATKEKSKGFAIAGLVIGIVDIIAGIFNIVASTMTLL